MPVADDKPQDQMIIYRCTCSAAKTITLKGGAVLDKLIAAANLSVEGKKAAKKN